MHPKIEEWLELLLNIRVGKQVVVLRGPRDHPDIRNARTKTKTFEIWRMSKSLIVYPEGYKLIPPEEFKGLDGTVPDIRQEFSEKEMAPALAQWLIAHRESKIFFVHDDDPYWKLTCQLANAEATANVTVQELGYVLKLETGEKQDQTVDYPRRLRDFLEVLTPEQEEKILSFIASGGLETCRKGK